MEATGGGRSCGERMGVSLLVEEPASPGYEVQLTRERGPVAEEQLTKDALGDRVGDIEADAKMTKCDSELGGPPVVDQAVVCTGG